MLYIDQFARRYINIMLARLDISSTGVLSSQKGTHLNQTTHRTTNVIAAMCVWRVGRLTTHVLIRNVILLLRFPVQRNTTEHASKFKLL